MIMCQGLGTVQVAILAFLEGKNGLVPLHEVANGVFGADCTDIQRIMIKNSARSLARRGLVEVSAFWLNECGIPVNAQAVRLLNGSSGATRSPQGLCPVKLNGTERPSVPEHPDESVEVICTCFGRVFRRDLTGGACNSCVVDGKPGKYSPRLPIPGVDLESDRWC